MRSRCKGLTLAGLLVSCASICYGATINGTLKGPDGAWLRGAFVQAQNTKTRMTFMALTDSQGRYHIEKLPAGEYQVVTKATGYRADPQSGIVLTADQNMSLDLSAQKSAVRWNEISIYQARKLWPASEAKEKIFTHCFICHGFQTRMASTRRDEEGWQDRVQFMREAMHFSLSWRFNDHDAASVAAYLNSLYGQESVLAKSPADMPQYKDTLRPFSNEAMNIAYVEYDMPGPSRMPFSAAPDKNGYLWIPNFGIANKISRLDPGTGEMQDFPAPNSGTAAIHSAVPAPDGSVWITEQASNKLGKWDPSTQKITEYQDPWVAGKEGTMPGGSKHTVRFDAKGNMWSSGDPLSRFDVETGKFTNFWEVANTYSIAIDKNDNVWYTSPRTNEIGQVDAKTMKISKWTMPSTSPTKTSYPRRIEIDSNGGVWIAEFDAGKMARFDPQTRTFKEFQLPGPEPTPYGIAIAADQGVWYSSYNMDVIGHLDPKSGNVTEYPFPHSENTIREFFPDSQGRIWYGTPSNNKVGYFYLTGAATRDSN